LRKKKKKKKKKTRNLRSSEGICTIEVGKTAPTTYVSYKGSSSL
jgi:hypothetical protein